MLNLSASLPTCIISNIRRDYGSLTDILITLILLLVIFMTVAGNVSVIVSYIKDHHVRRMPGNHFILSLSVADLLVGCFSLPIYMQNFVLKRWVLGDKLCELYTSFDFSITLVSTITIIYISLDRYWMVTKKLKYRSFQTKRRSQIMIITSWVVTILLEMILFMSWSAINNEDELYQFGICSAPMMESRLGSVVIVILQIAFPWTIIVCLYISVFIKICRQNRLFVRNKKSGQDINRKDGIETIDQARQSETVSRSNSENNSIPENDIANQGAIIENIPNGQNEVLPEYFINMAFDGSVVDIGISDNRCMHDEILPTDAVMEGRIGDQMHSEPLCGDATLGKIERGCDNESLDIADMNRVHVSAVKKDKTNGKVAKNMSLDIRVSQKRMKPTVANRQFSGRLRIHERRELSRIQHAAFMITTLVLAFFICWTPFAIVHVYDAFCDGNCLSLFTKEFTSTFVWLNSMINPIIYAVTNVRFRKSLLRLIKAPRLRAG